MFKRDALEGNSKLYKRLA